jgi:hypothetical protein
MFAGKKEVVTAYDEMVYAGGFNSTPAYGHSEEKSDDDKKKSEDDVDDEVDKLLGNDKK